MFMSTLYGQYYKKMIGNLSSGICDLVIIGEQIEEGLKNDKTQSNNNSQVSMKKLFNNNNKRKEGETNGVLSRGSPQVPSTQVRYYY